MYLMTGTLRRWEWMLFLWHIRRGWWYKACLSVRICMDSGSERMICTSTLCLQDSKGLFKYSCPFFFFLFILYWYVLCDEKNVRVSGILFLSFSLAWGGKYIENLLVKLFTLSHNMSNNCKAVCSDNLGRPCIVTGIDSEVSHWTASGIQLITPGDNFPFVLPALTKEKSKGTQRWGLFFFSSWILITLPWSCFSLGYNFLLCDASG